MSVNKESKFIYEKEGVVGCGKLKGKVALITGGDSGIGRAVAQAFAIEGADIAIVYLNEHNDAKDAKKAVESKGRRCILISGDLIKESFCQKAIEATIKEFGKLDILINNAAQQYPQESLEDITSSQLDKIFKTNIYSMFYMSKFALKYLKEHSCIINTTSVAAYVGNERLLDYSSTKGAIVSFTRALAKNLSGRKIRVNGVAPGPVWTPLAAASFPEQHPNSPESDSMKRSAHPFEIAPSYVFLASEDSSFYTGQILHPNGGEIING